MGLEQQKLIRSLVEEVQLLEEIVAMLYGRGDLPSEGLMTRRDVFLRDKAQEIWSNNETHG